MYEHLQSNTTMPTPFHMLMDELARGGRLRHYTQNIDCVERGLPHLEARTVRLHGRVDRARCQLCNWVCDSEPRSYQGAHLPICGRCSDRNQAREIEGKRSLSIGRLRPDVLLYGEPHPDDKEIIKAVKEDLRVRPELVLVVGTTLKVPGARSIAANLCQAARSAGGASFWISKEAPGASIKALFDYVLIGDSDEVALNVLKTSD